MVRIAKGAVVAVAAAWLGLATASAQVSVPHTFSAGTPAKASEVNANFEALAAALNALGMTPIPADGSYSGLQHSVSNTMTGRNVVVQRGYDQVAGVYRYVVRVSYQNGTVNVNGVPTSFAYVRDVMFVTSDGSGTGLNSAARYLQGTNSLSSDDWNVEVIGYAAAADLTASTATLDTDTRFDDYLCYSGAAISSLLRNCRLKRTESGAPTVILDDSRVDTLITSAFTAGPAALPFNNGGIAGSWVSDNSDRKWFLVARNVGIVSESRRHGVINASGGDYRPNMVTFGVIYYRIDGVATGSLSGTMWANANNQILFTP